VLDVDAEPDPHVVVVGEACAVTLAVLDGELATLSECVAEPQPDTDCDAEELTLDDA